MTSGESKVKLISAPSTENMVCRLISEDGEIEMGVYPVIFGFRVRAGYVGEPWYEIDWCCGSDRKMLMIAYSILKKLLEQPTNFSKILPSSSIKPYFNDPKFMQWLEDYLPYDIQILPQLHEIKKEYYDIIRKLRGLDVIYTPNHYATLEPPEQD